MEQGREPDVQPVGMLIGETVANPAGEELGSIEEIMIDMEEGAVAYAILSVDDPGGRGDRLCAIPWGSLRHDGESGRLLLDADRDKLSASPAFERGAWPRMADRGWGEEIHRYFGQLPYWQQAYYSGHSPGPAQMGGRKKPSPFQ